jgi:hypothetical protein
MDITRLKELMELREQELECYLQLRNKSTDGYIRLLPAQNSIDICSGRIYELEGLIREEEANIKDKQLEEHFHRVNEHQVTCEGAKEIEAATIIGKCSNFYLHGNDRYCTLTLGKIGSTTISLDEEWDVSRVKAYAEYRRICIQGGISENLDEILGFRSVCRSTYHIQHGSIMMERLNEVLDLQVRLNELDKKVEDLEYLLLERNKK